MEGGGDAPPTPAASASCSDWFCQTESLCCATLPVVKGHFSLISAFLTDFSSRSTPMLGQERPWKGLRALQSTPVWGTEHRCQALQMVSQDKTPLPALKSVKTALVSPLLLLWAGGGQPCCHYRGGDSAGLWEQPPVPTAPSLTRPCLSVPPVPLGTSYSCSRCCPALTTVCCCRDLLCCAGSRLQTSNAGRSKMHPGTLPGRALGRRR